MTIGIAPVTAIHAAALVPSLAWLGAASVVVVLLFGLARVPVALAWRQVVPILWVLAFAVPVQVLFGGWEAAAVMAVRLVLAVAFAAIYTLTTPVTATLDAMQVLLRPFRRWIDPDRVGLADLADRPAHRLSGGQKQLLAIAAVLVAEPAIVVADEPTTLLDARNARRVAEHFESLDQQLVVVSHQLELLESFDRVIVMDEGRVVADDAPSAALDAYRALIG